MTSCRHSPTGSTRSWASAGPSSPEVSASASPSRAPFSRMRPCSSLTRPPRTWTPSTSRRCRTPSPCSRATAPPSSSPTGCPPCATPVRSSSSTRGAWWRRAPTRRWSPWAGCMLASSRASSAPRPPSALPADEYCASAYSFQLYRRPALWAHTRKPIARFNDSDVSRGAAAKPIRKRIRVERIRAVRAIVRRLSPGSAQVHRHEVLALRFQSPSSVTFEGCLHSVARASQARLVKPPEPLGATCCKRVFRVLLQLPIRDQVLTAFVYLQNDRQHRRPSVHFHPPRSPSVSCSCDMRPGTWRPLLLPPSYRGSVDRTSR